MFTGIIETKGRIAALESKSGGGIRMLFDCASVFDRLADGDSIAVDGVCLTVVRKEPPSFVAVDLAPETLEKTNLKDKKSGDHVNLELPLTSGSFISGHFVQGHVDGTGRVAGWKREGDDVKLQVALPEDMLPYVVVKGSITVNGVSLTVAAIDASVVEIALIPYTLQKTNLSSLNRDDLVNIETDILGKYVVSLVKNEYHKSTP